MEHGDVYEHLGDRKVGCKFETGMSFRETMLLSSPPPSPLLKWTEEGLVKPYLAVHWVCGSYVSVVLWR